MNDFLVTILVILVLCIIEYLVFLIVNKYKYDRQIKRIIIVATSILLLSIFIPVFVDRVIISSSIRSNISNDQWVGFLGNYLGAILGGIITMYALIETLLYNNNINNIVKNENLDNRKDNGPRLAVFDIKGPSKIDDVEVVQLDIESRLISGQSNNFHQGSYIYLEISNIGKYKAENVNIGIEVIDEDYNIQKIKGISKLKKFSILKEDEKFVLQCNINVHPLESFTNLPSFMLSITYDDRINATLTESYELCKKLNLCRIDRNVKLELSDLKENR